MYVGGGGGLRSELDRPRAGPRPACCQGAFAPAACRRRLPCVDSPSAVWLSVPYKPYTVSLTLSMLFQQLECPPAPGPLPRSDFNLALLDEMLKEPRLKMVTCCAELSAG